MYICDYLNYDLSCLRRMETTYSQASQDLFALYISKHKQNGWFVEIGANDPVMTNNTYLLESAYGWKGLMVEYDGSFLEKYKALRPNSYYAMNDARRVDYKGFLDNNNFPSRIDYLQIDLDVDNRSTLDVLELLDRTVFDKYTFSCITFEHDIYRGDYFDTRAQSRALLEKRGYVLAFPDVCVFWQEGLKPFEDWYIHKDVLDAATMESLQNHTSWSHYDIIRKIKTVV